MPTAQPLRTGDPHRLGDYELAGRLGEGGQGAVFLGSRGGERYAVKLLHGSVGDETGAFLREVELAKHVARFCTAQVIDAGFDEGRPYIVSEYVDGPSLHREVSLTGPRQGGALERLAVGTATALAAIHRAGIVHRDFKPQNVLLGPDGPRVIDFGLARALDAAATVTNRGVGTPAYMAPEQITASAVTGAADVFSWGATMCFAANASAPFGQDSVAPVLHRILTAPPELGRLDGRLRVLVAACLDKDARNRPSSRELLLSLLGDSDDAPAEVLASPPEAVYGNVPLIPGPRTSSPLAEPEATGAAGAYHLRSDTGGREVVGEGPQLGRTGGPAHDESGSGGDGRPGPGEGSRWASAAGDRSRSGEGSRWASDEGDRSGSGEGNRWASDEGDRSGSGGRRAGWVQAVVAVCAALVVTGAVLLTVILPALGGGQRSAQAPVSVGSSVPVTPATSRPVASSPGGKPSDKQRAPTVVPTTERPVTTVAIPALAGLGRAAAVKVVKAAGLSVGAVSKVDSPRKIGQVLGSRPAPGTVVDRGSAVSLQVSAGLSVPSVAGMPRKAAEAALTAAGFEVGTVTRSCSGEADGQVLSTRPGAGSRAAGGSAVALTVARTGASVPSVLGLSRGDARAELVAAGFTVRARGQVVDDESKVDTVVSQTVAPGTCAEPGTVIVIVVGVAGQTGPGPEEGTPTPTSPVIGE